MNLLIKLKGQFYSLFSLLLVLLLSVNALAEGTRQMSPTNSANGTALVVWPANTRGTYLNAPVDQRLQFTIDDHTTENMYFGFHTRTYNNINSIVVTDAYYRVYNQSGTQVAGPTLIPTTGAGYIQDYNEAFAGPNIGGATPAGYIPFLFDPTTNGDFYIEIYRSSDGGTTSNNLEIMMPFFDFTVSDVSNNQVDGRVWCRKWSFATVDLVATSGGINTYNNALGGSSLADFFVYTQDQQILSIDFQTGFNPLAFEITTNFYGISNTGNFLNDRRSTNNFTGVSPTLANGYQIFLNQPDLNIYPISPTSQPAITSNIFGCPGNYFIPYVISEAGDISIFLDLNGTVGYQAGTADLVLEDYGLAAGNHLMAWDGLDGLGNVAPVNVSTSVIVTIYRGRTNIPLFDAELNTNGLIVTGLFPATNNRPLYWDDRLLTASTGACNGASNNTEVTILGTSAQAGMLDGVLGPSHAWDGTGSGNIVPAPNSGTDGSASPNLLCDDFGNIRTVNTWFWALDASSPSTAMIVPDCDVDGDGIDDITDIDNDNDGILDVDENIDDPFADNDGDLIYNYLDLDYPGFVDINSDGINDLFDLDLDGLVNAIDLDSDGDGCLDVFEAGYTDVSPADGEVDGTGYNPDGTVSGSDGYGLPLDANGNFVFDYLENIDTDGDGFGDNCDDDDDNDGIVDNLDNAPLDPSSCIDDDGDGCDDCSQTANNDFAPGANNDITNDGIDTDGDGICDLGDPDDDNDGCPDAMDTNPLVANPLNIVATATPNAICAGDAVALSATGGATYSWDNALGAGGSKTVNPTTTTTYIVTGDNGLGCTSTGTVTVTVTPLPTTPVATNNSPICEGETLSLTASTITGATYAWTGPSSFTSTSQNPTVSNSATILMSGTYSVTATVAGCTSLPATTTVTVNTIPSAPTVGSNSPVCAVTGNINLTASTITGATYAWTGPSSFTSTSQNPSITGAIASNAGAYNVTATVAGCISPSASTVVVVNSCGPTANDDVAIANLLEDGADGTISILGNDTDIDGTPAAPTNNVGQYIIDLDPSTPGTQTTFTDGTGTWTYNPTTGVVTFDPANDYNGTATITYELFDPEGNSDQAVITFTVDPVNDAPSQGNETLSGVQEDATTPTTSGDLTGNNIDPDGTTVTLTTIVSTTGGGTVVDNGDGTVDYTPASNFNGVDTVIYTVCDAGTPMPAQCVNDTLFVTVDPVNDAPSQGNETLTGVQEDATTPTTSGDLTGNNIDPDGTTTTVTTIVSTTGGGTVVNNGDGTVDYTPASNFNGVDTVIYTVCDAGTPMPAQCVNDTLFVTVDPVNDAPSQGNETLTGVQEDATTPTTSVDLTGNNIDPDGTTTTVTTIVSTTGGGTVVNNGDGTVDYTPASNFNGVDTVIYTVCDAGTPMPAQCVNDTLFVTVDPVNDAPSQGNETLTGVQEDATTPTTSVDLTGNNIDPDGTTTTVTTIVSTTGGGTVVNNGDGTVDYTPASNFNGVDTVIYTVCDAGTPMPAQCVNDTLFVTVDPVNDAPSQGNETLTGVQEDATTPTTSGDLTGNNIDPDGTTTTVTTIVSTTGGGTVVNNGDGTVDYTPASNFNGVDTVIYTVCDAGTPMPAQCVNDTLFVTVDPVNDAPSQGNETLTGVQEDATTPTTSGDLTGNNIDPDGTTTTVTTIVSTTGGGTVVNNGDGTVDYTPAPNFNGVDTVIYTVCDAGTPMPAQCVNDTLFVTVDPVNDPPVVDNETHTTPEDTPVSGDLTDAGDSDVDGNLVVTTTPLTVPSNGSIVINTDGTYTYTPNQDYVGNDTVVVTICDDGTPLPALCTTDTIFIEVTPVNDAPSQGNETLTGVQEDAVNPTTSVDLTGNNIDPDGTTVTLTTIVSTTGGGTVVDNGDGTVDYTPAPNFNGVDTVIYTVCDAGTPMPAQCVNDTLFVTVDPVNDAPSQGNETLTVNEDDPATTSVDLTGNNIDTDGTTVTLTTIVSTTGGGTVVDNGDGTVDYTPAPNFNGVDTVIYTVCDAGTPMPAQCVNDTLFVTVNPVNDPPVVDNEIISVPINGSTGGDLTDIGDSDIDGNLVVTTTPLTGPSNGSIVINPDGTYTYTPNPGYTGNDTVVVTICDDGTPLPALCTTDTIFITVTPTNPPVATDNNDNTLEDTPVTFNVSNDDTDSDGTIDDSTVDLDPGTPGIQNTFTSPDGVWTVDSNGNVTFTPNQDYNGTATINYTVNDNDGATSNTAVLTVIVTPVNDPPVVDNETHTTPEDTPVSGDLTGAGDSDVDGNLVVATTPLTGPNNGSIVINIDGTYTYTPNQDYVGNDTVVVTICDDGTPLPALCTTDTIFIEVTPLNDAPSQGNETLTGIQEDDVNPTTSVDLTGNNIDPDGTATTVTTIVSTTGGGNVVDNGDGTVDYTPAPNFNGVDTVVYTVCDAGTPMPAQCVNDTLFVTVDPVNDPPVVDNETHTTPEDTPVSGDLTDAGDSDVDGNLVVTTTPLTGPSNGSIVINIDGTYTYTPNQDYVGNDTVVVTICDDGTPLPALCTTDTIFIEVTPLNDAPSQGNENLTGVQEDATTPTTSVDLTGNNIDPDGTTTTVTTILSTTGGGTVVNNGDGTVDYTPAPNFNGVDTVIYTVCDAGTPMPAQCVNDTLFVTVDPVNDAPSQGNETLTVNEDDPATTSVDLTVNNIDPDGTTTTVTTIVSTTGGGAVVDNGDGTVDYTPAPNFNGVDTVIYTVCDAGTPMPAQCVNDTLFVTVNPVNDMPIIDNEYHTISQNTPVGGDLTDAGDSDVDGNLVVTTTPLSGPSNGTIVINTDGTYTYTPNPNYVGLDTVLVTICDDGTPLPANCLTDTIFITIIACDLNDPAIDCDGDGVINGDELADGTDPANGCDFVLTSASVAPSAQWIADDCDGDGVINGDEINDGTNPQDDCEYTLTSITSTITSLADCDGDGVTNADEINGTDGDPLTTNDNTNPNDDCDFNASDITVAVTSLGDCDGDGVTNTDEAIDGTNPQDDCDFLLGSITITVTSTNDCDGDGIPNNVEIPNGDNPLDPCDPIQGPGYTGYDASNPIWAASDCDNDGDLNGDEVTGGTPSDPYCDQSTIANPAGVCCDPTDPTLDCDGDGVLNGTEIADGTNPNDPCEFILTNATETPDAVWLANDCDGDGVTNEDEVNDGTNPQDDCEYSISSISLPITSMADCDGDGVTNADEINGTDGDPLTTNDNTDPNDDCDYNTSDITVIVTSVGDCDGDGVTNTDEANDGTNPQDDCDFLSASITLPITSTADCDGDGVTNADEIANGTNPQDDCDFLVANITLPITSIADCDGDGVINSNEVLGGTDPFDPCSLNILAQTVTPDANWNTADCDGDGIDNGTEVIDGTDPMLPCDPIQFPGYTGYDASNLIWAAGDCDNDGDLNGDEVNAGIPSDPYCDQSTIVNPAGTCCDPTDVTLDCDGDGVLNGAEIADGTNPYDACDFNILSATVLPDLSWMTSDCDGDGVTNADEVAGTDGDPLTTNDNTDPLDPCDYNVAQVTVVVTANGDCDGDGVTDADENVGPDGIANSGDETDPQDDCDFDLGSITLPVSSTSDCDGDGVINSDEFADNTNPLDPCDFDLASVTVAQTGAWLTADCDGDGVTNEDELNGTDGDPLTTNDNTDPNNPCEFNVGQITIAATSIEDCDGDGVTNADEINGTDGDPLTTNDNTDPNDECDFNSVDITLVITSNGDCDGDGVTNEQEGLDGTDPADPCDLVVANQDAIPTNAWNDDDCDNDGLTNGEEATGVDDPTTPDSPNGETTDPTNPDTDGDGVIDGTEGTDGTDPNNPCDYDTTSVTVAQGGDWNNADCDGDGVTNEQEVLDGTNPDDPCDLLVANQNVIPDTTWYANDCDNDGLTNEEEISGIDNPSTPDTPNGETTDPLNPDTDGDGVTDGTEGTDGTNPNNPCDYDSTNVTVAQGGDWNTSDCDGDGVTNEQEVLDGTDPINPCDLLVANQTATPDSTWLANDCDNDGLTNEEEITGVDDPSTPTDPNGNVTDPTNPDTDGDGVTDGDEAVDGTNPNDPCDLLIASQTVPASDSLWNDIDCDNDGLTNEEETTGIDNPLTPNNPNGNVTDPLDADSDGDGVLDGTEAADGTDPNDPCSFIEASITETVTADAPCQISIPEGFSPNGDGVNDYFVIDGLDNYEKVEVIIMNRWGNKVFESNDYQNDWDGTNKFGVSIGGDELPTSTYFYIIDLGEGEEVRKGYIYLNR